jgi:hypothetical protein
MTTIILILVSAAVGGVLTHFYWTAFHKAEMDGKDVLNEETRIAKEWAEHELARVKAKLASAEQYLAGGSTAKTLPAPPPLADPSFPVSG